jgi:hypothetical protein
MFTILASLILMNFLSSNPLLKINSSLIYNTSSFVSCPSSISESDSTFKKKKNFYYKYDLRNHSERFQNLDSLFKKFEDRLETDNFLDEKFFENLQKRMRHYFERIPEIDEKRLNEMFKDFKNKFDKDSIYKRYEFFKRKNLLDQSELTEI